MLVRFAFTDILRIPAFHGMTQFDLLKREMDGVVAPYLFTLGANVDLGLKIQACKHRTIDLKDTVGYCYVLLERSDKEWLANRNCSMSARIHSQTDPELQNDLVRMSMEGSNEAKFRAMCVAAGGKDGTTRKVVKDESETWQDDLAMIKTLRDIQKDIRGYLHSDEDLLADEQ